MNAVMLSGCVYAPSNDYNLITDANNHKSIMFFVYAKTTSGVRKQFKTMVQVRAYNGLADYVTTKVKNGDLISLTGFVHMDHWRGGEKDGYVIKYRTYVVMTELLWSAKAGWASDLAGQTAPKVQPPPVPTEPPEDVTDEELEARLPDWGFRFGVYNAKED